MSNTNKDKKTTHFRLSLLDAKTHQQLKSVRFTRTTFIITTVCVAVILCAAIFSLIAFTPIRTFIPGYPDASTKQAKEAGNEKFLKSQDSLLRKTIQDEEMFEIAGRNTRSLPIEGMHFFTPLKGVITEGYDPALHPYVDIAAPEGTAVNAIADGTVIYTGWSEETGHTIQLQHDSDIISIYKHNDKLIKNVGDKVKAGTPIALVGSTGSLSTGPHLHFELWYKGESIDPTNHINF